MNSGYVVSLSNSYIETANDIHIWRHKESANVNMCNHLHTYNELEIILAGKGENIYSNLNIPLKSGSIYIIPPFLSHKINMLTDFEIITVSFNDRIVQYPKVLNKIKAGANYCDFSEKEFSEINQLVEKIEALIYSNDVFAKEMRSALLNTLLIKIVSSTKVYNPYTLDNDLPQKLKNAIAYINNNLNRDISLSDVADAVKLTPNHLSSIFKKHLCISYIDYLCEQRLEQSKALISDRELSISKISRMVGFNSPAYFTERFKKRFGISPLKYRNEINT